MKSCRCVAALAGLVAMTFTFVDACAEENDLWPIDQQFNLSLGVFLLDTDTTIRVDGQAARGTPVNLDNTFDFSSQDRFRADGYWRFAKRHKVRFMYFATRSDSTRTIDQTIEFQGVEYPVNATVRGEVNTDIIELAYEYSFLHRHNFELAGTVGLHNLSIDTRLSAQGSGSGAGSGFDQSSSAKGDGPLPVIGLRAIWALSDHFYFDAQAQFFAIKIDEYDGSLQDYKVSFVWQPLRNVGIGIGYNDFETRLDVDASRFNGRLELSYAGGLAFVTVAF